MGTVPAPRSPRVPVPARGLHMPRHERVPRGQELPTVRQIERAMLGVPQPFLRVVHVKVQGRHLGVSHRISVPSPPLSLSPVRGITAPEEAVARILIIAPGFGLRCDDGSWLTTSLLVIAIS